VIHFGKGAVKGLKVAFQRMPTVEIEGSADSLGNFLDGHIFTKKLIATVLEIVHILPLLL
jgi:hypothetical protein